MKLSLLSTARTSILSSEVLQMFEQYKDILTVDEVCKALTMGKNTIYKLLRDNTIKSIKVGKKYFIPKIALIDFINANT